MAIVTRLYDSYEDAAAAITRLKRAGFKDSEISVLGRQTAVGSAAADAVTGAEVGGVAGAGVGLLAGLGVLAIPGIGPVVAAGWLATTALGAAAGAAAGAATGGVVGALTDSGVIATDADIYAESIGCGGSVVAVRTSSYYEAEVERILDGDQSVDVWYEDYRKDGRRLHDPTLPPYVPPFL